MHLTNPSSQAIQAPPPQRRKASHRWLHEASISGQKANVESISRVRPLDRAVIPQVGSSYMISSAHIENFRCYKSLDLKDLGLINVIVGECGSGKTALLEALFLPGCNHNALIGYLMNRGFQIPQIPRWSNVDFESIYLPLFHQFDSENHPHVSLKGSAANQRSITLNFDRAAVLQLPIGEAGKSNDAPLSSTTLGVARPLLIKSIGSSGKPSEIKISFDTGTQKLEVTGEPSPTAHIALFHAGAFTTAQESAQQFSDLNKKKSSPSFAVRFSKIINKVFPLIDNISVESAMGGSFILHCSCKGVDDKIPLNFVSSGINKLTAILLGIVAGAGGVVLIDEIENGFYYKSLPKMWETIMAFASEYETQVFASTHSKECLDAFLPVVSRNEKHCRLLRSEIEKGGSHGVRVFSGKVFEAVLETGEVDARSGE